jgi:FAD:protein FMN transferase
VTGPAAGRGTHVVRSRFDALGTYVELVTAGRPAAIGTATRLLRAHLDALDVACSRFRSDSELSRVNASAGRTVPVGPLFAAALAAALRAAAETGGDVDPTLGGALVAAGYDRDFAALPADGPAVRPAPPRAGAWREIALEPDAVTVPAGVALDLGATAKAFGADLAAAAIAAETGAGVLVNLGGDIAVAGPLPAAGWPVRVGDRPRWDGDGSGQVVHLHGGGLATSSTAVRRWRRGGADLHHVLDPRTGRPAAPVWRTVTVTAATCLDANTASTAAIVRGAAAPAWLAGLGLPARLLHQDRTVHRVAGWPTERAGGSAARGGPVPGSEWDAATVDGPHATERDLHGTVRVDRPHANTRATTVVDVPAMLGIPQRTVTVDTPEAIVGGER